MIVDDLINDLAATGEALPEEAMRWALDHWEEAGPAFVALLNGYARGLDRSERTERALFLVLHLLADRQETAAFDGLCRLLHDTEAAEMVLGDAIAETLAGLLISTYDGNAAALCSLVEGISVDELVRGEALLALAYLTRTERVPEQATSAYLRRLRQDMQPQAEHFVWTAWVMAVAMLGYEDLAGHAENLIRRRFVPADVMYVSHFRQDLRRTLDDPARMAGFGHEGIGPFRDAIGTLVERYDFSAPSDTGPSGPEHASYEMPRPASNPLRGIGRNDPCPCGSGRKYKKCCLV